MTSPDSITQITALGLEPTYSASGDQPNHLGVSHMWSVSRHSGRPSLDARHHGHCLGPRDMPLEAKRVRDVAVAIPIVAICDLITTCSGQ